MRIRDDRQGPSMSNGTSSKTAQTKPDDGCEGVPAVQVAGIKKMLRQARRKPMPLLRWLLVGGAVLLLRMRGSTALIAAGLARDRPRFSGGRYSALEPDAARKLPFPSYCQPR